VVDDFIRWRLLMERSEQASEEWAVAAPHPEQQQQPPQGHQQGQQQEEEQQQADNVAAASAAAGGPGALPGDDPALDYATLELLEVEDVDRLLRGIAAVSLATTPVPPALAAAMAARGAGESGSGETVAWALSHKRWVSGRILLALHQLSQGNAMTTPLLRAVLNFVEAAIPSDRIQAIHAGHLQRQQQRWQQPAGSAAASAFEAEGAHLLPNLPHLPLGALHQLLGFICIQLGMRAPLMQTVFDAQRVSSMTASCHSVATSGRRRRPAALLCFCMPCVDLNPDHCPPMSACSSAALQAGDEDLIRACLEVMNGSDKPDGGCSSREQEVAVTEGGLQWALLNLQAAPGLSLPFEPSHFMVRCCFQVAQAPAFISMLMQGTPAPPATTL
jgi:hypothetical protein